MNRTVQRKEIISRYALLLVALLLTPVAVWPTDSTPLPSTYHENGLMWIIPNEDIQRPWQDAISYCSELVFADLTDWHLPTKSELESIVDYDKFYPAIQQTFTCQSSFYWSATPHTDNPAYAWSVFCMDGADHWVHKSNNYYVRCVRATQPAHITHTYIDKKSTVIAQATSLEWQKDTSDTLQTWQNALDYCETLSLGSKTDWRLPDIRELKSLVDYNRYYPAITPTIPCQSSSYWSATTVANDAQDSAWSIFFGNGDDIWRKKTEGHRVRCVRTRITGL